MRRFHSLAISLLAASCLTGQDATRETGTQQAGASSAKTSYETLVSEFTQAQQAYIQRVRTLVQSKDYRDARKSHDRAAMIEMQRAIPRMDMAAFVTRAKKAAKRYAGTDDAIDFLSWIALNGGDPKAARAAVATLTKDHIESKGLRPLAESLIRVRALLGRDAYGAFRDELIEKTPHDLVRAWALYWRGYMARRNRRAAPQDKEQAAADLQKAATLAAGTDLADLIAAPRFQKEHLQVGMIAPDIVGEDLDGVPFKLSDYRGKVVVIDFWGDW